MVFWVLVAVLVAGVTLAITRPLMRPAEQVATDADADIAVYKDQLNEIATDEARGTLATRVAARLRCRPPRMRSSWTTRSRPSGNPVIWC